MSETAAVYWESIIRIYGFKELKRLSLFSIVHPFERAGYWGEQIQSMDEGSFDLVFVQGLCRESAQLCIIFEEKFCNSCRLKIEKAVESEANTSCTFNFPVEVVVFHGPHFQDRYGIANAAFDVLQKAGLPVLASGCSGTSMYIVLPENAARPAIESLGQKFVVP